MPLISDDADDDADQRRRNLFSKKCQKVVHNGDLAKAAQLPKINLGDFAAWKTLPGSTPPKRPDVNLQLARIMSIHKRDSQAKIAGQSKIRKRGDITQKRVRTK